MKRITTCEVCGVTNETKKVSYCTAAGMYLCGKHRGQMSRHGKITDPTSRTTDDKNEIITHETYAEVVIRDKTNNIVAKAKIDLDDIEKVSEHKWNVVPARKALYIYTRYPKHMKLHRFILDYAGSDEIDHINRDTLDNRKHNLRIVPRSENLANNAAKHTYKAGNKWCYDIVRCGHRYRQGNFDSEEDAQKAMKKCLADVSARVNELLNEFNSKSVIGRFKGVYYRCGKYFAKYNKNGKQYYVGLYSTPEEAFKAREAFIAKFNSERG